MINIFKIKDSYLVLKGEKILPEERVRAQNLKYKDYKDTNGATYQSFDAERSMELNKELPKDKYPYCSSEFYNGLKNNNDIEYEIKKYPNCHFVYPYFVVNDDVIPAGFKNMGIRIHRELHIYKMKYDEVQKKFILTDENGTPCKENSMHAEANSSSIIMHTDLYGFEHDDMKRLSQLYKYMHSKGIKESALKQNLSPRDVALLDTWNLVQKKIKKSEKQQAYSFHHEMKHLRNKYLLNQLDLAPNRGGIDVADFYRLCEYDEKSAHLAENLKAIGTYISQGDPNNFEMFPEKSQWLVERLKKTPIHKRNLLLSNYKLIVKGTFTYWDMVHKDNYQKQFQGVVKDWAESKAPISFCYSDKNEYAKRRSALLTLTVVDPVTKKNEKIDFSRFIENDISITSNIKSDIIEPSEEIIRKRRDKLNMLGITKMIVKRVQMLHRQNNLSLNVQAENGR